MIKSFLPSSQRKRTSEKMSAKNGDIVEQSEVRWVGHAAMGCATKAPDIGLYNICTCIYCA